MGKRRMISLDVVDTDKFLQMPVTSRLLYHELNLRADDDGFVGSPLKIMTMIGCSLDDLKILEARNYIIPFETGIIVIKDWKINNYIRLDRYKPTVYTKEKQMLTENETGEYQLVTIGIPNDNQLVNQRDTQVKISKVNISKDNRESKKFKEPTLEEIQEYIKNKNLSVDPKQFYDYFKEGKWIDSKGNKVKNWKQKLLTWNSYKRKTGTANTYEYTKNTIQNLEELYEN